MDEWSKVMETGATPPVDIFPFLKYLPQRFFFPGWKSRARAVGAAMDDLYGRMVTRVLQRRHRLLEQQKSFPHPTTATSSSFLGSVLDQQEATSSTKGSPNNPRLTHHELSFLVGVLLEGGSDTSASIILAFIQAMIVYPAVQAAAHAEIDAVLGEERSPSWADRACLPYVGQIVKETMRWRPVTPLAFPHATSQGW
ncbi:hypothetical protein MMC14_009092 [Varicellaria rhodocarpa]|nr:hypothetical protein [Varicellaria rhodocarpa]